MELYRKYRPKTLKQMFGNKSSISVIQEMVNDDKIPHSILLTGQTGTGKTTLGRILKELLGCNDFDYTELDTASFRGIDTIRDLRKQLPYAPKGSDSKVFLLDEVHELTGTAQHALLKALEECPLHVYFILCTTNPEKLLGTVKGRCVTFEMELLSDDDMQELISSVIKKEEKKITEDVIQNIIDNAEGHPRNALTILEKVLVLTNKQEMLKITSQSLLDTNIKELYQKLLKGDNWKEISRILQGLKDLPHESIRRGILGYMSSVMLNTSKGNDRAWYIASWVYDKNTFDNGFAGIVFCCYAITKGIDGPY